MKKRVEKYAEMSKGIQYLEWLELQKTINEMFREKTRKLQEELRLNFGEKEEGGEK
ncbi:hypothetical protein [Lachnoanaerobaculum saburreum]|jgi:hypothetical protein|uniref:Uncharacterized protein n=1 Tax=Lachnoanaerobaculum saburreum DSM 3986 TaxID=887325 RepID=E6LK73_9FIRM|nr:hypothetical protein [Lachnoanaerobaculum saburreum]EFU77713.1 hypothetical protein HMPREF0381_0358 [Lachnoanaerobaculum saburreum DSM 3986]